MFQCRHYAFSEISKKKITQNMKNHSRKLLIIGPNFFFSIANRPKTSPNHIFLFHFAPLLYNDFGWNIP